jgi:dihydroorotase
MKKYLITNARVVNEGEIKACDVLIAGDRIERIAPSISDSTAEVIDLAGNYLIPGMIDDQVHFRDPGLTYKADLETESRAAVAGGVTSFMDMPNTVPNTLTRELLEEKYQQASQKSLANYSFFMGITAANLEEALRVDNESVCGITDDGLYLEKQEILANNPEYLEKLFSRAETLVALHSEDDSIIRENLIAARNLFGDDIPIEMHPKIRTVEACVEATKRVLEIQARYNNRLHLFHISTGEEAKLFSNDLPTIEKRVTAEACVHHLWFNHADYRELGSKIMWNPSVKWEDDRQELLRAVQDGRLDIIATDHAPHALTEKFGHYLQIKSGAPMVQHALVVLFELVARGELSLTSLVERTSHRVADCYRMKDRGYIREGYFADLVEVETNHPWVVTPDSLHYKCGWSPLVGTRFQSVIKRTIVSGNLVYESGKFISDQKGQRLQFANIR